MREDLLHLVALTHIPGIGAVTAKNLISYCGGAERVFVAKRRELLNVPGVGDRMAATILNTDILHKAERELRHLDGQRTRAVTFLDDEYPKRLQKHNDAPIVLFVRGEFDFNRARTVGIVGTRKPTPQGISITEEIVEDLKPFGTHIISGLAYGVDAAAHSKALEVGLQTIGVLGHGFGTLYPAANRKLAERMTRQGGLLTEYPYATKPDYHNFPMRNRIVAGLSDALIVVESAARGGSLITAHAANRYGMEVFAVPGRIRDAKSEGCNDLIRTQRANLFQSVAQLADFMGWDEHTNTPSAAQRRLFMELSEEERAIVDILEQREETPIDMLAFQTKKTATQLAGVLLELEFKGLIRMLPGKRFILT